MLPGRPTNWALEHIFPLQPINKHDEYSGGEHSYANTAVSHHAPCNASKHNKLIFAWAFLGDPDLAREASQLFGERILDPDKNSGRAMFERVFWPKQKRLGKARRKAYGTALANLMDDMLEQEAA